MKQTISHPAGTVARLITEAFPATRPARSTVYMDGVRAVLMFQLRQEPLVCPHLVGSTSADAFHSGVEEGRQIWARYIEQMHGSAPRSAVPINAADQLADELLKAHDIIDALFAQLNTEQILAVAAALNLQRTLGRDGLLRVRARRNVLRTCGFLKPDFPDSSVGAA